MTLRYFLMVCVVMLAGCNSSQDDDRDNNVATPANNIAPALVTPVLAKPPTMTKVDSNLRPPL